MDTINNEEWKPLFIHGDKTSYLISNKGRIKNTITDNILSTRLSDGYIRVSLKTNDGYREYNVAKLMLLTFKNLHSNHDTYLYFYDGNRLNLSIDNMDYLDINKIYELENAKIFKKKGNDTYILRCGNEVNEVWKQLIADNHIFHYMISSHGRVINLLTGLFLNPTLPKSNPYPCISLRHDGISYRFSMHRLVAELFVENPNPSVYNIVNHLNENKQDYRAENLEWTSNSGNVLYSLNNNTNPNKGSNATQATITEETASKICEMIEAGYRTCEIVNTLGVKRGVIRHIKEGHTWKDISRNYNFSSSFNSYITDDTIENIIQLRDSGKSYDEIRSITGVSTTTLSRIFQKYGKIKKHKVVTPNIKSKTTWSVMLLYNHNLSVDEISEVLGLSKSKIENIILYN